MRNLAKRLHLSIRANAVKALSRMGRDHRYNKNSLTRDAFIDGYIQGVLDERHEMEE